MEEIEGIKIHRVRRIKKVTYPEASSKVIPEALACGVSIVATNGEGILELLEGTGNLMVKPKDVNDLREKI